MSGRSQTWPVPFCRPLQEQFGPGSVLIIDGFIPSKGRFDVNLAAGPQALDPTPRDDVPLHLSCRLNEGKIVVNSCLHGTWGKDEVRFKSPFDKGSNFEIRIRAHQENFELFANGKEIGTFPHRQRLGTITHLCIWGEVELHGVRWQGRYYVLPFRTAVPNGLQPGARLYVSGVFNENAKRLELNLVSGSGDVIFHYNPRFDEKKVVRNNCVNTHWQAEEREGGFPFTKGRTFDIIIDAKPDAYHVFVDGKDFCTFKHRVPPSDVRGIQIDGDIELQGVELQ